MAFLTQEYGKGEKYMKRMLDFVRLHKQFAILSALVFLLILTAVSAPLWIKISPYDSNLKDAFLPPGGEHLFGTDKLGRDVFSRVIYGSRISLTSSLLLTISVLFLGTVLGITAGYFGGVIDTVVMRIADMLISFPGMVLAIAVAGIMGASTMNAVIAILIVSWTKYARLARSLVLKIRHKDYIYAALTTGSKNLYILKKYMLPNVMPTLIVTAASDIGTMMLELAGLSFLGFGAKPPLAEWGLMLNEGRIYMMDYPWLMIYPGFAICIVVVIFNLLGDSLRDILDPRNKTK